MCDQGELCVGGSVCDETQRKCVCAAGHRVRRDTCVLNGNSSSAIGEECAGSAGSKCEGGAECREQRCACPPGETNENGYCTKLERSRFSTYRPPTPAAFADRCPLPEQPTRCQLPDCFCSRNGREPPPGIPLEKLPQIVVLTFDDPVNDKSMRDYRHLFQDFRLVNPNGCPMKATFFVSHEWTNYDAVQWIAEQGHELASNSISHRVLSGANWTEWLAEMDGQRQIMAKFANVNEAEIVGMRAPQLGLGGDVQFLMARSSGFLYDNTISADPGIDGAPYWPHTLDFAVPYRCENDYCPRVSIPGMWALPMNVFHGTTEFLRSPMLQGMLVGNETADHVLYFLFRNFNRAYTQNRAPYILNLNAEFLQSHGGVGMRALENFLGLMTQYPDVYFLTMRELVEWMRAPQSVDQLAQKGRCPQFTYAAPSAAPTCRQPNKCMYQTPGLGSKEHQFLTCNRCPMTYPWTNNPMGATF
ncbi:Polysaccharide deacetylase [Aphelenchoides fujianensis]|nr:Polysaccharide deacetylase [Aphelenchoides fujianensis]